MKISNININCIHRTYFYKISRFTGDFVVVVVKPQKIQHKKNHNFHFHFSEAIVVTSNNLKS